MTFSAGMARGPIAMLEGALGERLKLDDTQLLAELGTLEVMGLICRETGNRFRRTL